MGAKFTVTEEEKLVGKRLAALRKSCGFKNRLSAANALGLTEGRYRVLEEGVEMRFTTIKRISEVFNISMDYLYEYLYEGIDHNKSSKNCDPAKEFNEKLLGTGIYVRYADNNSQEYIKIHFMSDDDFQTGYGNTQDRQDVYVGGGRTDTFGKQLENALSLAEIAGEKTRLQVLRDNIKSISNFIAK